MKVSQVLVLGAMAILVANDTFVEFLTLPAYERID